MVWTSRTGWEESACSGIATEALQNVMLGIKNQDVSQKDTAMSIDEQAARFQMHINTCRWNTAQCRHKRRPAKRQTGPPPRAPP